ncbi:MAG: hypothetical protein K9L32_04845 [Chromatiaceae bacterium]|nr:hypothetical protein [Chromatiaceae bacterium]
MTDDNKGALTQRPSTEFTKTGRQTSAILDRMTSEVLVRAQEQNAFESTRYRIGEYELKTPDYQQIVQWAREFRTTPEAMLSLLAESYIEEDDGYISYEFTINCGAIQKIVWDFEKIPFVPQQWQPQLDVYLVYFTGNWPGIYRKLQPQPDCLKVLECANMGLESIDLSLVPKLVNLDIPDNNLADIDLKHVPKLTGLDCNNNDLSQLDLWDLPELLALFCRGNRINELELPPLRRFYVLDCSRNALKKINLSATPGLRFLDCCRNQIGEINLSRLPLLERLDCSENKLSELDLSRVPGLLSLNCCGNAFSELDLTQVRDLRYLCCDEGTRIINAPPGLKLEYGLVG